MKILNFGSCNIDHVYNVEHIVVEGETESTTKLELFSGGKGLNQSIAIARAGSEIYHAGCIGYDGSILRNTLAENKVNVSYLKECKEPSGHAVIQVDSKGNNAIFLYSGSNSMITKEDIESVLMDFSKGDIVVLQNEISNIEYIITQAYKKGMCIILNPSPMDEKICNIDLNMISYILLNEIEARQITGQILPEESLEFFKNKYPHLKVVLTLGSKGCVFMGGSNEIRQPAFEVNVIDTTAAGDTFTGYFVSAISKEVDYAEAIKISSAASAIAVSRSGASSSIPQREEVLKFLKKIKS